MIYLNKRKSHLAVLKIPFYGSCSSDPCMVILYEMDKGDKEVEIARKKRTSSVVILSCVWPRKHRTYSHCNYDRENSSHR